MTTSIHHPKFQLFSLLFIVLILSSCGSYQQASYYEDDGIYASGNRVARVEKKSAEAVRIDDKENDIYGDYFGQKANEYGEILEDEIFTDVDSYSSNGVIDSTAIGAQIDYFDTGNNYNGNTAWGDNPSNVTINVYENPGFYDPFFFGGFGFGYSPFFYNRFGFGGFGFNRFGFGFNRFGFGFNRFGFGGFGFPYYGYGGFYGPFFGSRFYGGFGGGFNRGFAFNRSRRGYAGTRIPGTSIRGSRSAFVSRSGRNSLTRSRAGVSRTSSVRRSSVASRSGRSFRNPSSRRVASSTAAVRNRSFRTSRSTRTAPTNRSGARSYGTSPNRTRAYRSGTAPRSRRYSSSSGRSTRSFQGRSSSSSRRSTFSRSGSSRSSRSFRSSGSSRSSRSFSSGSRSSRSSGSFRSSGGGRSSVGRSSGGRSGGRRR